MHPILRIGLLLRQLQVVDTRKKFQKLVHILQVMGAPYPESFDLNHYGAYSSELRAELDAFIIEGLVEETCSDEGNGVVSYSLRPTQRLIDLVGEFPGPTEHEWLNWAKTLNRHNPTELEGISTVLYLCQRGWPKAAWRKRFELIKPHLADRYGSFEAKATEMLALCGKHAA